MQEQFARTELLLGQESLKRLQQSRVAVFGVGGVGGYTAEALARSGIGALDLIDNDRVSITNLNRQIYALHSTIGRYKVDVARERILDINPQARVKIYRTFYLPETADQFDFTSYDYIVDAIDTVTGKLMLVQQAAKAGVPIISAMGAGNKMDPTAFQVADISETSVCPLAKVMRRELKKRGITGLKVVYSREKPRIPGSCQGETEFHDCLERKQKLSQTAENGSERAVSGRSQEAQSRRRQIPGSNAFVPAAAGLIAAAEVIKDLR